MDPSCYFSEIFGTGACFEFWLNRYQTLLVGLIAVGVAILQILITMRQKDIVHTQEAIVAKQQEQSENIEQLTAEVKTANQIEIENLEQELKELRAAQDKAIADAREAEAKFGPDSPEVRALSERLMYYDGHGSILERAINVRRMFGEPQS